MTVSINQTLTQTENNFKVIVLKNLVNTEITSLCIAWPWIAPAKFILTGVVNIFVNRLYAVAVKYIDIGAIKLKNSVAQAALTEADLKLQVIGLESGVTSDAYQQALAAEANTFSQSVRYNQ